METRTARRDGGPARGQRPGAETTSREPRAWLGSRTCGRAGAEAAWPYGRQCLAESAWRGGQARAAAARRASCALRGVGAAPSAVLGREARGACGPSVCLNVC